MALISQHWVLCVVGFTSLTAREWETCSAGGGAGEEAGLLCYTGICSTPVTAAVRDVVGSWCASCFSCEGSFSPVAVMTYL